METQYIIKITKLSGDFKKKIYCNFLFFSKSNMIKTKDFSSKMPSVKKVKTHPTTKEHQEITDFSHIDFQEDYYGKPSKIAQNVPIYLISNFGKLGKGTFSPIFNVNYWKNSEFYSNSLDFFKRKSLKMFVFMPFIFDPEFRSELLIFSREIQEFLNKIEIIMIFTDSILTINEFYRENLENLKDFSLVSDIKLEIYERYGLKGEESLEKGVFLINFTSIIMEKTSNLT